VGQQKPESFALGMLLVYQFNRDSAAPARKAGLESAPVWLLNGSMRLPRLLLLLALLTDSSFLSASAQSPSPAASPSPSPNPVVMANRRIAAADRLRMLGLLHMTDPLNLAALPLGTRPGPPANYDESKANPFPLTNPLQLKNGKLVTDAAAWWSERRPEIASDFATEIYGKIPADTPPVHWQVVSTDTNAAGGMAIRQSIVGTVDNSAYPAASAQIDLTLYLPTHATGPVPVIVEIISGSSQGPVKDPVTLPLILGQGWGCATASTYTVQADTGAGLNNGIIGIMNRGQPREPDQWGVLAAWSWGLSRAVDYLETDKAVDPKRLGVEGHSRWGKTALLCAALDSRWSIVYASCSGEGGAKPSRRLWGETLDNVCGNAEYHWMAGNCLKYIHHWDKLPVDSPELISLIAPRPVFIGCGSTDLWADPHGQFLAVVAAGPVWRLLGAKDVGSTTQPPPNTELISGDIGYRMHLGGHTDVLDFPTFLKFAGKYWNKN
jgi:hypothetical protein